MISKKDSLHFECEKKGFWLGKGFCAILCLICEVQRRLEKVQNKTKS